MFSCAAHHQLRAEGFSAEQVDRLLLKDSASDKRLRSNPVLEPLRPSEALPHLELWPLRPLRFSEPLPRSSELRRELLRRQFSDRPLLAMYRPLDRWEAEEDQHLETCPTKVLLFCFQLKLYLSSATFNYSSL